MKKTYALLVVLITLISCNKETKIEFSETHIETSEHADISMNFPKAEGTEEIARKINTTLETYIVNQTNLGESTASDLTIPDAIAKFNYDYNSFKNDFPDTSQKWEAFIDGEVTHRSPELICIAINSYLDTGGAHGNTNVRFFNFNPQTGKLYQTKDLIGNIKGFSEVVEQKLKDEINKNSEASMTDEFFGKDFQLPETIGFSDEGVIILYNPYEIASYAQGILEFTIPFEDLNSFLNIY
ncbi:DUF3298 and DUF4163 domain-containing protein [Psychroserpens sp. SPM9]|uniref:DUF3298 and DUF4163 domain-containing protein n=1 Tax=Psychroserpens sp. SPM9 TaxID=2975598 RepID=UPI0021A2799A|nr:DUF3298 and DUF4163 domain-containing protein [Psychroserpens sp. SPM9]MDG5490509.1 DUF4163 domain-containing protein [Psychroserpens sp. SPM9]